MRLPQAHKCGKDYIREYGNGPRRFQEADHKGYEDTLETINKNLSLLVKGRELDIKQSAAVLSVAIDAYYAGKE